MVIPLDRSPQDAGELQQELNTLREEINALGFDSNTTYIYVVDYGVVPDSAADQSVDVQKALDFAGQIGGGVVAFPVGTVIAKALTLPNYTYIEGAGIGSTLKLADNANTFLIASSSYVNNTVSANNYGGIRSISLDGNKANNSSGSLFILRAFRNTIRDVRFIDSPLHGILYTEQSANGTSSGGQADNKIRDSYFVNGNGAGIYGAGGPSNRLADMSIIGNTFASNGASSIYYDIDLERSAGFLIANNQLGGNLNGEINALGAGGLKIVGNDLSGTTNMAVGVPVKQVHIQAQTWGNFTFVGNTIRTNALTLGTATEWIMLDVIQQGESGGVVEGNSFYATDLPAVTTITQSGSASGTAPLRVGKNVWTAATPAPLASASIDITPAYTGSFAGRNWLDNGAMSVNQRGIVTTTGGTTSVPSTAYPSDRWGIYTNIASGAGRGLAVATSSITGFSNFLRVFRNSGALTQPVCVIQEIETVRAKQLQGQKVILSAWLGALSGMTGDGIVTGYVITGTGTDQGLGAFTASPAITPAWTGVASQVGLTSTALSITFAYFYGAPITIPSGATEIAIIFAFTPSGSSSGAADGFGITGVMLEHAAFHQVTPSSYEFLPADVNLARCQRYYYQVNETNGGVFANGMISATNAQTVMLPLPVTMRSVPAVTVTAGGFQFNIAGTGTAVGAGFAAGATQTTSGVSLVGTVTATVGQATQLIGTNTTGIIRASADF